MFFYTYRCENEKAMSVFMAIRNGRLFWSLQECESYIKSLDEAYEYFPIVLNGAEMMSAQEMEAAK